MVDFVQVQLALRTRLQTLVVCTTGSVTLSATATGYARTTGSFLTDGFAAGMEVTPSGFTQTAVGVVESVTALALTIVGGRTVEASGAGRTLAVNLPTTVQWENTAIEPVTPYPYVEEEFIPATSEIMSGPYASGYIRDEGLYVIRWYSQDEVDTLAHGRAATALLQLFKAGTSIVAGDGSSVRVRGKPAPWKGAIRRSSPGWSVITVTIPWRLYSLNT